MEIFLSTALGHWKCHTGILKCYFIGQKVRQVSRRCTVRSYVLWIGQKCCSREQDRVKIAHMPAQNQFLNSDSLHTYPQLTKKSPICVASNMGTWALVASVCTYSLIAHQLHIGTRVILFVAEVRF